MRLAALFLALIPTLGHAEPRVVSINLCTDQIAMMLAAPGQIASVSWLARDPMLSSMAAEAAGFPANRGQAEQVFLMRPEVVLASPYSSRPVIDLLRRLGLRVEEIPPAMTLDDVPAQIMATGRAMAREAEAEALVAEFRANLPAIPQAKGRAASYQPNGHTAAPGTMGDGIMARAGWGNVATGSTLPLEQLLLANPDLLILAQTYPGTSRSEEMLRHPALSALEARIERSGADWICGTPHVLRAIAALSR